MYAPSKDIPSFWNDAYTIHNQKPNPHKIIIGNFNCTLDPQADTIGYKTDLHKKSRTVINQWLSNETTILEPVQKKTTVTGQNTKTQGKN